MQTGGSPAQDSPNTPHDEPGNASLRDLVLPVYLPALLLATGSGALSTFLPLFLRSLGASVGLAATVIGIGTAGVLLFDLPSGFLTARYGERRVLTVSGVVMVFATLLIGASRGLLMAGAGIFLVHASVSFWFIGRLAFMRRVLRPDVRGRGLATAGGVMRVGQFCGPVAGGFLAEAVGFRAVFYGTSLLAAGSLVFFLIFERTVEHARGGTAGPAPAGVGLRSLFDMARSSVDLPALWRLFRSKRRIFATAGVSMVLLSLVRAGRLLVFPLWGQQIGLDTSAIGLAVGISSAMDTMMFYPAGTMSDRLGRRWSAVSCLAILSVGMALIPLTGSFTTFLLAGLVVGIGNGLGSGINMTLAADFARGSEPGVFLGLWRLITDMGVAAAPLLVGLVASVLALGPASLVIAGFGLVGAAYHGRFVEETLVRGRGVDSPGGSG